MGWFQVVAGQIVASSHVNTLVKQSVVPFTNAAARDAAITGPVIGQCCYLTDIGQLQVYRGPTNGWIPVGGVMPAAVLTWPGFSGAVGSNIPKGTPSATGLHGGMTYDSATGKVAVPVNGLYRIDFQGGTAATNTHCQATIRATSGAAIQGSLAQAQATWGTMSVAGTQMYMSAGESIWGDVTLGAAASISPPRLTINYTGQY